MPAVEDMIVFFGRHYGAMRHEWRVCLVRCTEYDRGSLKVAGIVENCSLLIKIIVAGLYSVTKTRMALDTYVHVPSMSVENDTERPLRWLDNLLFNWTPHTSYHIRSYSVHHLIEKIPEKILRLGHGRWRDVCWCQSGRCDPPVTPVIKRFWDYKITTFWVAACQLWVRL